MGSVGEHLLPGPEAGFRTSPLPSLASGAPPSAGWRVTSAMLAQCHPRAPPSEVALPFVTALLGLWDVALLASPCCRSLVGSAKNVTVS